MTNCGSMNDDDDDDDNHSVNFENLFQTNELRSTINHVVEEIKPDYEPVHIPLSITEILETWTNESFELISQRLGVCPGDSSSIDGMFMHTWSASHIEQPYRLTAIIEYLHEHLWGNHKLRWKSIQGRVATNEEIQLVHSENYLHDFLCVERGVTVDNIPSMRTLSYANARYSFKSVGPIVARACRIATGVTLNLIASVVRHDIDYGFGFVRPAGHHSWIDQIGTFCGLNSVAIGAVYAIRVLQVSRVLILDWDVHRSGGTEQIIGQLSNDEQTKCRLIDIYAAFGNNSAFTWIPSNCQLIDLSKNSQLPGDYEYLQMFNAKIVPDIIRFCPSLILISAGYDAAEGEAEACAQLTPNGYYQMTRRLKELKIPLVFILEGGYQREILVRSVAATIQALLDS